MNNRIHTALRLSMISAILMLTSCEREISTNELATYPNLSEVFFDTFAPDLQYQAWGKVTNFDIDTEVSYTGTSSMKIDVPEPSDPMGSWAGGTFYSQTGRNLSEYDAITFYAKASISTKMETGIGNFGDKQYIVGLTDVKVGTSWSKIVIPIPNPTKLIAEQGLFYYSAGAVDGKGYTLWIDDVKFEKLGTLAHAKIESVTVPAFPGVLNIGILTETVNLPNGQNQKMEVSANYFTFESSDNAIASVDNGVITVHKQGAVTITMKEAEGEIKVNSLELAPIPAHDASAVLSLYSDTYENGITANWNPRWEYSTAEYDEINSGINHVGRYSGLNFVGIVFDRTANCTNKNYLHMDIFCMDAVNFASELKIEIHATAGTDSQVTYLVKQETHPGFQGNKWLSIDIPLNEHGKQISQLVLACSADIPNLLIDNLYFY